MTDKLQVAGKTDPQLVDREICGQQLWQRIGAIKLANGVAASLSSQSMRALEAIRDDKLYLATEFRTFDSFLDKHPESPMSHETFRRRSNLLKDEGDVTFDLLNSLKVPVTARQLLAGQVSVEGDEITIGDSKCKLSDEAGIVVLINTLHAKAQEQSRTIERGKKDVDKWKRKHDEAQEQLAKGLSVSEDGAPHARALVSVLGNFQILANECKALTNQKERKRFAPIVFQRIAEASKQVEEALGFKTPDSQLDLSDEEIASAAGE